jgi:hypothetical protein
MHLLKNAAAVPNSDSRYIGFGLAFFLVAGGAWLAGCGRTDLLPPGNVSSGMGGSVPILTLPIGSGGSAGALGSGGDVRGNTTEETGGIINIAPGSGGATTLRGTGGSLPPATSVPANCPCSRRPGENNSFMCPPGTGQASFASIGKQGGTLTLNGTPSTKGVAVTVAIPANAFASLVVISITETTLAPPAGYVDASPVYDIEALPAGTILLQPVPVNIPFQNSISIYSQQLSIYASTDGLQYTRVQDTYINAGFLQGSLSKFGYIFAGYPMSAAELATCGASGAAP